MGVHVVKRHAIVGVVCHAVVNVVIGVRIVVLSVPLIVVHIVVPILILYQFIELFPVAILSHIFSLYSHGILGVVFTEGGSRDRSLWSVSRLSQGSGSSSSQLVLHATRRLPLAGCGNVVGEVVMIWSAVS